ncbi:uncharacterized protein LOC134268392 [Saccostrea cucullata]|uniref:uncharacterized protein LOC134268392 n=1 Tax=Saccostrea cuccullata TaxID=36930 RepID=UPI002ED167B6
MAVVSFKRMNKLRAILLVVCILLEVQAKEGTQDFIDKYNRYNTVCKRMGYQNRNCSGKEKAPEDGLFSFMWTNVTKGGKQFHTEIVLNGKIIGYNHVNGVSGSSHWASGTSSAVIKMKRKDEVWIRTDGSFGLYAYADWSSFTGFKL